MTKDILLEIGTEEIPAGYIPPVLRQTEEILRDQFGTMRIKFNEFHSLATPRRLVWLITGVEERQEDLVKEIIGPPKKIGLDENGKWTQPALSFAKSQKINVAKIIVRKTAKGEYLTVVKKEIGRSVKNLLPALLSKMIISLSFPKSMRWITPKTETESPLCFARPIRWIMALWGDKPLKFQLANLKSTNVTYGHFIFSPKKITVTSWKKYKDALRNNYVIIDQEERKDIIRKEIEKLAEKYGALLVKDEELLEEAVYLVEYPTAVMGTFDKKFLSLPREVLITVMRKHQKYFSLMDKNKNILSRFIAIKNGPSQNLAVVQEGNERVLDARLEDARFFFNQDLKTGLASKVDKLKDIVFQKGLGSVYERTQRIIYLSEYILDRVVPTGAEKDRLRPLVGRIALLSKTDLVTEMVKEFPELEGVMGKEYALISGEEPGVANGIFEHWLPRTGEDELPQLPEAALVGLADKINTMAGDFWLGLVPSGSYDPYGLRRQAQGILRIILDKKWRLSIPEMIDYIQTRLPVSGDKDKCKKELLHFFAERLETIFTQQGYAYDEIKAVGAVKETGLADLLGDILQIEGKIKALHQVRSRPEIEPLTVAFKRVKNIFRQATEKGYVPFTTVQDNLLVDEVEKRLVLGLKESEHKIIPYCLELNYNEALQELVNLGQPIDNFFEKVLVMTDNQEITNNRLTILYKVRELFFNLADFSQLVLKKEG